MTIKTSEIQAFATFLREEYNAKPMLRTGEDGELLRAVFGANLLIISMFKDDSADVWCSDDSWLTQIWSRWSEHCAPVA